MVGRGEERGESSAPSSRCRVLVHCEPGWIRVHVHLLQRYISQGTVHT